jgi:sarcosine oxidase
MRHVMMSSTYDVIVIGAGAMGSSACFHLALRGARVLGLEQFGIPNSLGSSYGESRMIRLCYYEHPHYVPLLQRAYELWHELEGRSGQKLLHITGGLYMGQAGSEFINGTLRAATEYNLPHHRLSSGEISKQFSQFQLPEDYSGVFEPNAGFLLPERVIATHAELALRHGGELRGHERVLEWKRDGSGFVVRTSASLYRSSSLVICGGAWSGQLLANLGIDLVVTRQVLGWVWPKAPDRFALGVLPVWAIDHSDGTQHYGFPMLSGAQSSRPGFKIAHHFHGPPTTADAIDRVPGPSDEDDFRPILQRFIPEADGPLLSMLVCMYTNTPDSHFIIDTHPQEQGVIIASGFSGHGFKFASVVGEILADLAISGRTQHPIEFLSLRRFKR